MYAIVKTGGKQYRVEQGQSLLVERLPVEDGGVATLQPLLVVDGENVVDGEGLASASVSARVVGHERGPRLRVVKFKPKRGYRRRTGHRQDLTRIEVTEIKLASETGGAGGRGRSRRAPKPVAAEETESPTPVRAEAAAPSAEVSEAAAPSAEVSEEAVSTGTSEASATPEAEEAPATPTRSRRRPASTESESEEDNGA